MRNLVLLFALAAAGGFVPPDVAAQGPASVTPVADVTFIMRTAIQDWQDAYTHAQTYTVTSFSLGGLSAGLANAGVIIIGVLLGFTGDMTPGKVLAFAFLVSLFVGPVQMGTQILTDAQRATYKKMTGAAFEMPAMAPPPPPPGE